MHENSIKPDRQTRSITEQVSDQALPCRADGHGWPLADWEIESRSARGRLLHMVKTRECQHGCGTRKVQTQTIRINARGELVEIVDRSKPSLRYADKTYRAKLDDGQHRPGRAEYEFEMIARQFRSPVVRFKVV